MLDYFDEKPKHIISLGCERQRKLEKKSNKKKNKKQINKSKIKSNSNYNGSQHIK